nr:LuxR C-terminal-related transcriptional regulator [uncultured Dethiosulfovibrio sp.]
MGYLEEFRPPEIDGKQIYRQRIASALEEAKAKKGHWIYVSAPGGFGKTVAVSQWLKPQKNKLAWLNISERDNDEGTFVRRFLGALSFAQKANKKLQKEVERTSPPFVEHLFRSINLMLDNDKQYVLVLDDFHCINNNKILDIFPILIKTLPKQVTLCFIGRSIPNDVFVDSIFKNNITLISSKDLAFDSFELDSFLRQNRSKQDIEDILSRTGGWPIAVRALTMKTAGSPELRGSSIQEDLLFRYLDLHVWQRWDGKTQKFFMDLSLVQELNEDICRGITGIENSFDLLKDFYAKGNFMNAIGKGKYRLHDLFRDFLMEKLNATKTEEEIKELNKRIGDFFYGQGDYCSAVSFYVRCQYLQGISDCSASFTQYDPSLSIEARVEFFKKNIMNNGHIPVEKNPHLCAQCAFIHYMEGNIRNFIVFIEKLYDYLKIISDSKLKAIIYVLRCLDFRIHLTDYAEELTETKANHLPEKGKIRTGTFTAAMPILHRSLRERSELALDPENLSQNVEKLFAGLSPIFGYEHEAMLHCQRAGILYEQNKLTEAYQFALESHRSAISGDCRPELSFCARMILIAILKAMDRDEEARILSSEVKRWIEEEKLLFLMPNFRAWQFREKMEKGETEAGKEWLNSYSIPLMGSIPLYKMYQHFTTLRALIYTGSNALAVMFGERVLQLARDFHRPSDVIESSILLSVANWNIGDRERSLQYLEEALEEGCKYGYITLFMEKKEGLRPVVEAYLKGAKQDGKELSHYSMKIIVSIIERSTSEEHKLLPKIYLTDREILTLKLISQNLSYRRIAQEMEVSHSTAKYHVLKLYRSLGVSSGSEALVKAKQMGYI